MRIAQLTLSNKNLMTHKQLRLPFVCCSRLCIVVFVVVLFLILTFSKVLFFAFILVFFVSKIMFYFFTLLPANSLNILMT